MSRLLAIPLFALACDTPDDALATEQFSTSDQRTPQEVAARLRELGITLPDAPAPVANYVPAVRTGNLLFISGQVAIVNGKPEAGRLGENMEVEAGAVAARASGLSQAVATAGRQTGHSCG